MKTCQPKHAHTRVYPIIPIPSHLSGFEPLYPDGSWGTHTYTPSQSLSPFRPGFHPGSGAISKNEVFEVERILDMVVLHGKREWLCAWKGLYPTGNAWTPCIKARVYQ